MTLHSAEVVRTGAAAVRRSAISNPMELLTRIRAANPTSSFEVVYKKWRKQIEDNDQLLGASLLYAYRNYWTALDRDEARKRERERQQQASPIPTPPPREIQRTRTETAAAELASNIRRVVLLDLLLPSGKLLKEATFKECAKAGGWFARVARLGRPSQIVGETVTEERLQALRS